MSNTNINDTANIAKVANVAQNSSNNDNHALPTTYNALRQSFIDYFVKHGHTHVASSSLVPANDKTLLFTNAGMVQFKDLFLGKEKRSYTRAVTCQKCMRAGGKHNDLENVGYTKRHHTFFEMLGNFSFGDYFKREAINYAWDYLTNVLQLPASKLWITVHKRDADAEKIWLEEIKINPERFSKCDDKDNFWAMGETGPCGFCSEIYYDYGNDFHGNPPGSDSDEGERYVEIWNLVFMEFERDNDGNLHKLPNPSIDTGMGLERLTAVMQHTTTQGDNYAIDIFQQFLLDACQNPIIQPLLEKYIQNGKIEIIDTHDEHNNNVKQLNILDPQLKLALRVVCEHSRSALFMLADGITPSNEGQGYILRKIIRRAMRFVYLLGFRQPLLWQFALLWAQPNLMGNTTFYPEILKVTQHQAESLVAVMIKNEENQFIKTLEKGIEKFKSLLEEQNNSVFSGKDAFYLYDTFGFPVEVTKEMAQEVGLQVDENEFNLELEKQRQNSRLTSKFSTTDLKLNITTPTKFLGYNNFQHPNNATILELHDKDGAICQTLHTDEEGIIILDSTIFYAESGGQIGDSGKIYTANGNEFIVNDTKKIANIFLHYGIVTKGTFNAQQTVDTIINIEQRQATTVNHTSAHLLHQALRQILGEHATQKGSYVDAQRLRFDIAHHSAITTEQLRQIEQIVNAKIRENLTVTTEEKSLNEAKHTDGVLALFDEKYSDIVRVVKIQNFSAELCGGTHLQHTGEIGLFKIILETSVASGVRRIEALTGESARSWYENYVNDYHHIAHLIKAEHSQVFNKLNQILEQNLDLSKELAKLQQQIVNNQNANLTNEVIEINGFKVLAKHLPNIEIKTLRNLVDQCKQKLSSAIIILATTNNDKLQLIISVSEDYLNKITANDIMQYIAPQIEGSGGGRKDLAQGGGTKLEAIEASLHNTIQWLADNFYQ